MHNQVKQAVILAAGMGSRLRGEKQPLPKPLVMVGGLPLLKRTMLTAKREGITRFVVVVGCDGEQVKAAMAGDADLDGLEIQYVDNPDYKLSNGVSVLKARPFITGEFFLMMSDHVCDPAIYRTLQAEPAREGLVLAVDRKLSTIFDMDDATKVKTGERNRIVEIGKELTEYDAIDTGVFRCAPALFDALEAAYEANGDTSLSDGVQALAAQKKARVADVGAAWWQDVDDAPTRKHAEKLLFDSLTKNIDGPISRHVNRRFSKTITRMVMNTSIVPNHMTAVGLVIGLASAVVTAFASASSLWLFALGGILYQVSSMIDGCDGEIARLKFKHSDIGEWFDTVSDDVINLSYQLAVGFAIFRITGDQLWLQLGIATFILGWVIALSLYKQLLSTGNGTHLAIDWFGEEAEQGLWQKIAAKLEFIARRDFYALLLMVFAIIGVATLKFALVVSLVVLVGVALQWSIVILRTASTRRREAATARS